jgi:hypothetical protein
MINAAGAVLRATPVPQEQDRLALLGGLLDAERGQDPVVDGVVQEQHLGGLDDEAGQR